MTQHQLLNLRRSLFSLRELITKIQTSDFYNHIYDFCALSNSIYSYISTDLDSTELKKIIEGYPVMEVKYFNSKTLNLLEKAYRKLPVYSFKTASDLYDINIYPAKRLYMIESLKKINIITAKCDALIAETDKILKIQIPN